MGCWKNKFRKQKFRQTFLRKEQSQKIDAQPLSLFPKAHQEVVKWLEKFLIPNNRRRLKDGIYFLCHFLYLMVECLDFLIFGRLVAIQGDFVLALDSLQPHSSKHYPHANFRPPEIKANGAMLKSFRCFWRRFSTRPRLFMWPAHYAKAKLLVLWWMDGRGEKSKATFMSGGKCTLVCWAAGTWKLTCHVRSWPQKPPTGLWVNILSVNRKESCERR